MPLRLKTDNGIPFFWESCCGIYLLISWYFSYNGLLGSWTVSAFGIPFYYVWDPDSYYLVAGITFFDERYAGFVGHPGITLMFCIQVITWILYAFALLFNHSLNFAEFAAKNISTVILVTKLFITASYLFSFYVLYIIARLFLTKTFAQLAVIAFGTTSIILCYLNKISPEPLLLILVFSSYWFMLKYVQHNLVWKGYAYIVLCAITAALAVLTKMMIALPVPLFILGYIFFHRRIRFANKFTGGSVFLLSFAVVFIFCGRKVDWSNFVSFWFYYAPGSPKYEVSKGFFDNILLKSGVVLKYVGLMFFDSSSLQLWAPNLVSPLGLFNAATLPFMACSLLGFFLYWRKNPEKRCNLVAIVVLLMLLTPVVLYRHDYHYCVIHLGVAAIFVSYFVKIIFDRICKPGALKTIGSIVFILILNSFSLTIFYEVKYNDMLEYAKWWKPYFTALNHINYDERIGLVSAPGNSPGPGRSPLVYGAKDNPFFKAFNNYFVYLDKDPSLQTVNINKIALLLKFNPQSIDLEYVKN